MKQSRSRSEVYLDRVFGALAMMALHEAAALYGHIEAAGERVRIARRARNVGELLRNQVDLLPESRNRWSRDQQVRRDLWRGLVTDLAAASRQPRPGA